MELAKDGHQSVLWCWHVWVLDGVVAPAQIRASVPTFPKGRYPANLLDDAIGDSVLAMRRQRSPGALIDLDLRDGQRPCIVGLIQFPCSRWVHPDQTDRAVCWVEHKGFSDLVALVVLENRVHVILHVPVPVSELAVNQLIESSITDLLSFWLPRGLREAKVLVQRTEVSSGRKL